MIVVISIAGHSSSPPVIRAEATAAALNDRLQKTNKATMSDEGKKRGKQRSRQRQIKKAVENKATVLAQGKSALCSCKL